MRTTEDIEREYHKFNNLVPNYISYAKVLRETNLKDALGIYDNARKYSSIMIEDAILLNDENKVEVAERYLNESKSGIMFCKERLEKTR